MSRQKINENYSRLRENKYPGRGIIIGMSPDGKNLVQVYWIMGRSENSRNRVFENMNGFVRTKAFEEAKVTDPSLIIYYPAKNHGDIHIITNGDQTETIYEALKNGSSFEDALNTRCYEPDPPNLTPRISGIVYGKGSQYAYSLSILKSFNNTDGFCIRNFYNYEKGVPGIGLCIHTYECDGNPLPSFTGEPYELELFDSIDKTVDYYWDTLDKENRVSILTKFINLESGKAEIKIINKHR